MFNIAEDIKHRSLEQNVEILWISGPTWHDSAMIARVLRMTENEIVKILKKKKLL